MLTVEDFKKLSRLGNEGYHIYIDGEEVHGLLYDEEVDWMEYVDGTEAMCCNFTFVLDRYTIVQDLREFQKAEWTVEKHEEVNWHDL